MGTLEGTTLPAPTGPNRGQEKKEDKPPKKPEHKGGDNDPRDASGELETPLTSRTGKAPADSGGTNLGQPVADASGDQSDDPNEPQSTYDETAVRTDR